MARDRLTPLTTGDLIRELRLHDAPVSAGAKHAAARAAAAAMTDAEYSEIAQRNQMAMDSAAMRLNASAIAVFGPGAPLLHREGEQRSSSISRTCPKCQEPARGQTEDARVDWFGQHFNTRHGGAR